MDSKQREQIVQLGESYHRRRGHIQRKGVLEEAARLLYPKKTFDELHRRTQTEIIEAFIEGEQREREAKLSLQQLKQEYREFHAALRRRRPNWENPGSLQRTDTTARSKRKGRSKPKSSRVRKRGK